MKWKKLFSKQRLCRSDSRPEQGRNPFQQDLDRIVFSGSFRRLANKTQVHPLAENDLIHNRLTHSIETASVGRSLGTIVGSKVIAKEKLKDITEDEFGYVVQAACLAHDIGNPPFGHAGETAIGDWFEKEFNNQNSVLHKMPGNKRDEFLKFEGNAQGFRILTQLENNKFLGGLQLTYAILSTFTKYPRPAFLLNTLDGQYIGAKKYGFFSSEQKYYDQIGKTLGLIQKGSSSEGYYCRHPLAFLVEAADDICYNIVDLEDAVVTRDLQFDEVANLLEKLAGETDYSNHTNEEKIAYLRAKAIGEAVKQCAETFMTNYDSIMKGEYSNSLTEDPSNPLKDTFKQMKEKSKERIFTSQRKTELEISGHKIIFGILDTYKEVLVDLANNNWKENNLSGVSKKLIRLGELNFSNATDLYSCTQVITDFVSGMTDRYASDLFKKLSGNL